MLSTGKIRRMVQMLAIPTVVSVAMVLARFAYVADLRFRFCGLLLNLFLAWIPMILALAIWRLLLSKRLALWGIFVVWLLFFPNAFYIMTDLIHDHKFGMDGVFRWYDILMTACFAVTGMFLGSFSLYLLQSIVCSRWGRTSGWLFSGGVLALASFGTDLGRIVRLNSWDVFLRPGELLAKLASIWTNGAEIVVFCGAFFLFSAVVYSFVYSALHLHEPSCS